jgi:hypothetical protein
MKISLPARVTLRFGFSVAVALVALAPFQPAFAAEPTVGKPMMDKGMMDRCQAMMERKQKIMSEMKAQDEALTEAVARMNAATGGEKSAQLAAIVTTLAGQRAARRTGMAKLQEEMMGHMMDHMQAGKESMMDCPMMKDADEKSSNRHQGHN